MTRDYTGYILPARSVSDGWQGKQKKTGEGQRRNVKVLHEGEIKQQGDLSND
jgi:hypothetical protein